ncbi:MAG: serine/threonine protein kinase [Candidatus Margulisbacteria bacterium]|nr:serine/threonine protein kinase [Candidatus Margulisiibacteriota bacterium]MBU1022454.1 serine/threonine protein kinase [Candidatus Margulisiibacteriota bacterium]MBU1728438.1 serine/threonine protein kinase [Candidatus Margulisiibacteriota bacterium]MBU1954585.1 serine/threonine protein kinase [Candidatus Margulisiibacteriota bacterium]
MERFLKSRYRIGQKISENPYSVTYKGSYLSSDKPVIIKIYKRAALTSSLIKIIRKKVKSFSLINHHNIAKIIDGDYGWQGYYYVREYIEGQSLTQILNQSKTMSIPEATKIILSVCDALSVAHKNGVIHGAISPNNILISSQKIVKLTDFVVEGQIKEALPQKAAFVSLGANYISPEEANGETAGPSSDIYSAALVMYEMLAGRLPYNVTGKNVALKILLSKIQDAPPPLSTFSPEIPPIYGEILAKGLARDPMLRFTTIDDFAESLKNKNVVSNLPIHDVPNISFDIADRKNRSEERARIRVPEKQKRGFSYQFGNWLVKLLILAILCGMVLAIILTLTRP